MEQEARADNLRSDSGALEKIRRVVLTLVKSSGTPAELEAYLTVLKLLEKYMERER